jgi:hypothetical protein
MLPNASKDIKGARRANRGRESDTSRPLGARNEQNMMKRLRQFI